MLRNFYTKYSFRLDKEIEKSAGTYLHIFTFYGKYCVFHYHFMTLFHFRFLFLAINVEIVFTDILFHPNSFILHQFFIFALIFIFKKLDLQWTGQENKKFWIPWDVLWILVLILRVILEFDKRTLHKFLNFQFIQSLEKVW